VGEVHFKNGLDAYYEVVIPEQRVLYIAFVVKAPNSTLGRGLNVGSTDQEVRAALGEPTHATSKMLKYEGETEHVTFSVKGGRVESIEFNFYTG
jgi:hypothetical protein